MFGCLLVCVYVLLDEQLTQVRRWEVREQQTLMESDVLDM